MMRLLLLFCVVLATGCGQVAHEIPDTGATLEGTITLNGKPIPLAILKQYAVCSADKSCAWKILLKT
jgi:hypothetical protein